MFDLSSVKSSRQNRRQKYLIYGPPGVGKTSLAASFPKPLGIRTEDGMHHVDVDTFPLVTDWMQLQEILLNLGNTEQELPYETLIVDSVDWLERVIWKHVAAEHSAKSVDAIPYGRGFGDAAKMMGDFLDGLQGVYKRGLHIVLVAHSQVVKVEPPNADCYDCYAPRLHKKCCDLVMEWVDNIFFCDFLIRTRKEDKGFGNKRTVTLDSGEQRVLYTRPAPGHIAKNRLDIPEDSGCLPLSFDSIASFLTK